MEAIVDSVAVRNIYSAAARAIGARDPDPAVRNPDYLAERLLGNPLDLGAEFNDVAQALTLEYADAIKNRSVLGGVMMSMIRTRFIDECLQRRLAAGASQVVLLGAGFDTRASRFAELLATIPIPIFEVDRVQTQEVKKRRVSEALGGTPSNVTYVPIDVQHDDLAATLAAHGYDAARRTFFVWEGATVFLPESAVRSTLTFVCAHPSGSAIAFDYVYRPVIDRIPQIDVTDVPEPLREELQLFLDMVAVDPWLFGVPHHGERDFLGGFGLEPCEVLPIGGAESVRRYLTRSDGSAVGGGVVIDGVFNLLEAVVKGPASGRRGARLPRRRTAGEQPQPVPSTGRRDDRNIGPLKEVADGRMADHMGLGERTHTHRGTPPGRCVTRGGCAICRNDVRVADLHAGRAGRVSR